mmetsp:Transcript_9773/g.8610  ORF Transcript_9773/g.8610 Transcript_9773/m.8610 type:complete len:134 (+) Transcript_9773:245-646(+)
MNMVELEKTNETNALENKLPDYNFFEIAVLLLHHAGDDIRKSVVLRTLVEDLYELRRAKLIKNMKSTTFKADRIKKLDNITSFEVNMLRGQYYQEGYQISFSLWDLLTSVQSKTGGVAVGGRAEEEEAYDDDF